MSALWFFLGGVYVVTSGLRFHRSQAKPSWDLTHPSGMISFGIGLVAVSLVILTEKSPFWTLLFAWIGLVFGFGSFVLMVLHWVHRVPRRFWSRYEREHENEGGP
jgi:Na+/proline symporter